MQLRVVTDERVAQLFFYRAQADRLTHVPTFLDFIEEMLGPLWNDFAGAKRRCATHFGVRGKSASAGLDPAIGPEPSRNPWGFLLS